MMNLNNYIRILNSRIFFFGFIACTFISCETLDLDVQNSPNALSPNQAETDLFLNAIQLGLANFHSGEVASGFESVSEFSMNVTRVLHMFGPSYREAYSPSDYNQLWSNAYSFTLTDIREMTELATETNQFTHIAIGQIVEAYIMMTLVDFFGDVPYNEAIQGINGVKNPKLDSGESIYLAVDQLLLSAIENLGKTASSEPSVDLYYDGNNENWVRAANTLRIKLYLQARLSDAEGFGSSAATTVINDIIESEEYIDESAEDFQFRWGTNTSAPDSRHPYYEKNIGDGSPSSNFYMNNWFMNTMLNQYSVPDPRMRYYFYRQTSNFNNADQITKPCSTQSIPSNYGPNDVYCIVEGNGRSGYWGRDHGDSDGIPPDEEYRTLIGTFPFGGPFDDNSFREISGNSAASEGLQGAGISPFMLSSYTFFMLAEAALTLGITGNAENYLENAVRASINKTISFGSSLITTDNEELVPTSLEIDGYVQEIIDSFNATGNTGKMRILATQYFIASWGNGIEAYNTYRRTGQPDNLTPTQELADPGDFIRSHFYPEISTSRNSEVSQKDGVGNPVFWDTNPAGFVD